MTKKYTVKLEGHEPFEATIEEIKDAIRLTEVYLKQMEDKRKAFKEEAISLCSFFVALLVTLALCAYCAST